VCWSCSRDARASRRFSTTIAHLGSNPCLRVKAFAVVFSPGGEIRFDWGSRIELAEGVEACTRRPAISQ